MLAEAYAASNPGRCTSNDDVSIEQNSIEYICLQKGKCSADVGIHHGENYIQVAQCDS